jgi:hypothetical protein
MTVKSWDRLETAICDLKCMVELTSLARDHDGPVDFAISGTLEHVSAVQKLFYALHAEHHRDRTLAPLRLVAAESEDDDETADNESNVVPMCLDGGAADVH